MSMNNSNNQAKNLGFPPHYPNSGPMPMMIQGNNHHILSQPQHQTLGGHPHHFPGHFQLSEPQAQSLAQSQFVTAQAQAQAQAAHAQFQAQLQAQSQAHSLAPQQTANPSNPVPSAGGVGAGASSPSVTPGTAKRTNTRAPSRPPSSNMNASSPFKTMELTPAARRKKRKHADSQIPEKIASLLPESALYTQLLEYEARLDAAVARQKLDIQESLKLPPRFQRTLRVYVFNTFANQARAEKSGSGSGSDPPTWSLKIIGRILEDGKDPVVNGAIPKSSAKFSSFFKTITISLDRNLYPDNHLIHWESSRSSTLHEGFEVKREGDKEFSVAIRIEMNYAPEKFKLSYPLSELLGIEVDTRARIIAAIWQYVKSRKLQIPSDPTSFVCDPPLRRVFGEERMKFTAVPLKISQHLSPPQPIHLDHKIKLSGKCPAGTSCYDILVDLPLPLEKEMSAFLANSDKNKEIDACDELIASSIKKIHEHRRRRAFFLGFSQSPAEFINTLIASQSKDLKLVAGDAGRNAEKERHSDFYNQPWVEDAVIRYLNRKSAGNEAPGSI